MTATRTGTRLGGRYRLTERLAFGGMGEVWAGVDEVLGRAVAVKILRPELARDDAFRRRFREEARTAGGLSHPGIAAVYDYGEGPPTQPGGQYDPDGDPLGGSGGGGGYPGAGSGYDQHEPDWTSGNDVAYLVMELVPGKPLSGILSESAPLPPVRALELVAQAGRALHAAHQRGIVHRDVKPANLMVTPEGRVKVTDFGIARPQDHEPLTATGQVMGTAHYLAPELARGHLATALSDVYALGVVAYECVAGRRPFEGDNQVAVATAHLSEEPPPLPSNLPADVRRVIMTAMQKEPDYRFATADAFAEVLDFVRFRILADDPLPVWANRGPVPGVGTGSVRIPAHDDHSPSKQTGAAGFLADVGATSIVPPPQAGPEHRYPGAPGGSGTAALPLGRFGGRFGAEETEQPGNRSMLIPVVAGIGAVILIVGLIIAFSSLGKDGGDSTTGGTAPTTTQRTSSIEPTQIAPTTDDEPVPRTSTSSRRPFTPFPPRTRVSTPPAPTTDEPSTTPTQTPTSTPTQTPTSTPTQTSTSTPTQ